MYSNINSQNYVTFGVGNFHENAMCTTSSFDPGQWSEWLWRVSCKPLISKKNILIFQYQDLKSKLLRSKIPTWLVPKDGAFLQQPEMKVKLAHSMLVTHFEDREWHPPTRSTNSTFRVKLLEKVRVVPVWEPRDSPPPATTCEWVI
jgi:hypothetical protein